MRCEGISILIVEDDERQRRLYRQVFEIEGALVRTASCVLDAMHAIHEKQPHVILADILMPGPNGYDLLRDIRTESKLKDIPIIGMSFIEVPDPMALFRFDIFLKKPLDLPLLYDCVCNLARRTTTKSSEMRANGSA